MAGIELTRAADLLRRVLDHLVPLRDPAHGAGQREQHGEHRGREADRRQDDARIEIDVRIELLVDEIGVVERDMLQLARDVENRVLHAQLFEHFGRSEEHTSELQSLMRISYAVFCLKKKNKYNT